MDRERVKGYGLEAMISYGKQSITDDDITGVVSILKSDFLTQGPTVGQFEKIICEYTGAKYCVAVSNGTAALHLAVLALDIPSDSRGITSTNTFVASANSMQYCNIEVDFADIDSKTFNITSDTIEAVLRDNTKLIIPVHFAGQPCEMASIKTLAQKRELFIIEDAAHAIGSSYIDGDKVGSCKYSDLTTFSFHPVKTITTGEGGAITTNSKELFERLLVLRSHGITKEENKKTENPGPWYYEMKSLGFNYRLCDIQAALGISQIGKLDFFKQRRRELVRQYNLAFSQLSWLKIPYEMESVDSCFHLYVVLIDFVSLGITRTEVMNFLKGKGVGTQVHYIPVHSQPYYTNRGKYSCPNAIAYYEQALSLPLFPDLTNEMQTQVIESVVSLTVKE